MARTRLTATSEPQPGLVISLTSATLKARDGTIHRVATGEKVRADHPLVRAYPHMFCPENVTTAELHAATTAYHRESERRAGGTPSRTTTDRFRQVLADRGFVPQPKPEPGTRFRLGIDGMGNAAKHYRGYR